jgi:hypothetical protein
MDVTIGVIRTISINAFMELAKLAFARYPQLHTSLLNALVQATNRAFIQTITLLIHMLDTELGSLEGNTVAIHGGDCTCVILGTTILEIV